jgi:hypothetical protein
MTAMATDNVRDSYYPQGACILTKKRAASLSNISLSLHSSKLNANDFPEDVVVTLTTILQCQNQSFGIKFRCVSKAHKKECWTLQLKRLEVFTFHSIVAPAEKLRILLSLDDNSYVKARLYQLIQSKEEQRSQSRKRVVRSWNLLQDWNSLKWNIGP